MTRRLRRSLRAHPVVTVVAGAMVAVLGFVLWRQLAPVTDERYTTVSYEVPTAPRLDAGPGEWLLRIDPLASSATYSVKEEIIGADAGTATGRTQGIAGDLSVNRDQPGKSRVGQIVVDLRQLTSDNSLRDARIRADFLSSAQYPFARFTTNRVSGLPDQLPDGPVSFTLDGDLEVKAVTKPVSWKVDGRITKAGLTATATTTVKMSQFGIGPISIIGLVRTEDDITLTLQLSAVDPSVTRIATSLPGPPREPSGDGPSFARQVQPILAANCAGCHNSGEVGADVWKLDTAGDARSTAAGIATVTRARYMPPWPASDLGIPLKHQRKLSDDQLRTLSDWAAAGAPLDVDASTRVTPTPTADDAPAPRPDLTLTMPKPYAGDGTQTNDYRCFVLDPKFTQPTFVTGYQFTPQMRSVVHHVILYRVSAAAAAEAAAKDGADGRPGWQCFVGTGLRTMASATLGGPRTTYGMFAGWVPGNRPVVISGDAGFRFDAGDLIIAQLHYHYSNGVLADQSKLDLQLAPAGSDLRTLRVVNPIAPVEVPCPAGATEPLCNRDAMLRYVFDTYGAEAGFIPDFALQSCRRKIEEFANQTDGTGATSCDRRVFLDGQIVDVLGHMHQLGRSFRMTLNPGTPQEKILLDIPRWNFEWQLNYQPVDPVAVKRGDTIRIECSWDRSVQPTRPPRYLLFAEGTEDEMCFSTYTVLPAAKN